MLSLPRILLPVDFSGRSAGAATYARGLAARFDSEVLAVHVVDLRIFGFLAFLGQEDADSAAPPESEALAGQALDRFIEQHLGGVRSRRAVLFGDPARQIVRCSEREKSSLIVLPTHGYGPFRQNLLGSVVSKVLHDAACPVWTGVHMENHAVAEPLKIGRILCACPLDDQGIPVLSWAGQLAEAFAARLSIAHALPAPAVENPEFFDGKWREYIAAQVRRDLEGVRRAAGVEAEILVREGEIDDVVAATAKQVEADLVVIGRGAASGFAGRLRTFSYAIIRRSPCPVISV